MPELREAAAEADHRAGDRLQGHGLVQDGQPHEPEERERWIVNVRHKAGYKERRCLRHEEQLHVRREERDKIGVDEERGNILGARRLVSDVRLVVASFLSDECPFLAGGVAYQIFFSLIPLLALVVGIFGFVFGTDRAQREFVQLLRSVYPSASAQETRIARELVDGRALSLGIGLSGTVLGASAVFGSVDTALAHVFSGGSKRSFIRDRLHGLAFVGGIALLAVLSFALSYGAQTAQGALRDAGLATASRLLISLGSPLLGLAAGFVFFYTIFRFVPRVRFPASSARMAALVSAVLWELAKVGFAVFTRAVGAFSAYGPIAFAAGLLTWIYLTAVIILIGAELMKVRART